MANSGIQLPILLIFNVDMYSEMADSQNSAELGRGIGHFKIATFGRLSGIFPFQKLQLQTTQFIDYADFISFKRKPSSLKHKI